MVEIIIDQVNGTRDIQPTEADALRRSKSMGDGEACSAIPGGACGIPFHPLANIFPLMQGQSFEDLKADIERAGQREAIALFEGMILDGRNRARACEALGLVPVTEEWTGPGTPLEYIVRKNMLRRHLNESERAMIGAKLKHLFEEQARQRMLSGRASDPQANLPEGQARDHAAALAKVSGRTVDSASKVLRDGAPELVAAVESGQVRVSAAAAVAELPAEEQAQVVAQGGKAVRTKAKDIRTSKRKPGTATGSRRTPKQESEPRPETEAADEVPPPAAEPTCPAADAGDWTPQLAEQTLAKARAILDSLAPFLSDADAQQALRGMERRQREEHCAIYRGLAHTLATIIDLLADEGL